MPSIAAYTSDIGTALSGTTAGRIAAVRSSVLGRASALHHGAHKANVRGSATSQSVGVSAHHGHAHTWTRPQGLTKASARFAHRAHLKGTGIGITRANLDATHTFTSGISHAFSVGGTFPVDNASVYTVDADFLLPSGQRRSIGVLVYVRDVLLPADVASVPINRHFLIAGGFSGGPGDPLYDAGAFPNAIGRKITLAGTETLQFRDPIDGEVVIHVPQKAAIRYERDRDSGGLSWQDYRTMPQRFVDGLGVQELFDPERLLNFFSLLAGACMSQWTYETALVHQQRDPELTRAAFLPTLGADYGLQINAGDAEATQRAAIRSAVEVAKIGGTDRAIALRLLAYGYAALIHEVWINPGHAMLKLTADADGSLFNQPIIYQATAGLHNVILTSAMTGGGDNAAAVGYLIFRDDVSPSDGDTLTLYDGTARVVFEFDDRSVTASYATTLSASFGGTLPMVPLVAGSLTVTIATDFSYITVADDGVGGFVLFATAGDFTGITVVSGAVNYTSGVWTLVLSTAVGPGTVQTRHTHNGPVVSGSNTPVLIGATAAATLTTFIGIINGSALALTASDVTATGNFQAGAYPDQQPGVVYPLANTTGPKGAGLSFITVPHGFFTGAPRPPYFLSSRIAIYLASPDGTPLSVISEDEAERLAQIVSPILPAQVDIRVFGTLATPATGGEGLKMGETLVIV